MTKRIFTFLVAFLATLSGAVWGQTSSADSPIEINSSNIDDFTDAEGKEIYLGDRNTPGEYYYTLNNVNYVRDASACQVRPNCIVHLKIEGTNTLQSGQNFPGIFVPTSSTLIIEGDGTLNAICQADYGEYAYGAGIGGATVGSGMTADFGTIIIKGGTVNARCNGAAGTAHADAAGIGGGSGSQHGTIIITGGTVNATCYDNNGVMEKHAAGAAIGGGYNGTCDNITILGGKVTASNEGGNQGHNIGVGRGYSGNDHPSIIFGKWDINADKPEIVCQQNSIDKTNFLDAKEGTPTEANGVVTMPERTQMYLASEPTTSGFTLNAYYVNFHSSKLQADGEHNVNNFPDNKVNLYCGANHTIEVSNALTCTQNHNFMGWLKGTAANQGTEIIPSKGRNDAYSFNTGTNTPADYKNNKTVFTSVWVDNEYPISVKSGTEWTESGDLNQIFTTPDAAKTLLTYKLPSLDSYPELNGTNATGKQLQMSSNYLTGTPTLSSGDTYKQIELPVDVYVTTGGDTYKKTTNVKINIFDKKLVFTKVEQSDIPHAYNGSVHNDIGANENHLLKVTAQTEDGGSGSVEITDVKEEAHYRIYSYTYKSFLEGASEQNLKANDDDTKSLEIKDAGTYSNIVLEPLGENEFSSQGTGFSVESDGKAKLTNVTIEVKQKEVTVKPEANQECKVGDSFDLSSLKYTPAASTSTNIGEEKYNYSGTLSLGDSYADTNTKGAYTIQQGTLAFANATDGSGFKAANYKLVFSDEDVKFLVLKDISNDQNVTITFGATDLTYKGTAQDPKVSVSGLSDSDYTLSIEGADEQGKVTNAGTYTVTVTGNKEQFYTGIKTETFEVKPATITAVKANEQTVTLGKVNDEFVSEATSETVTLTGIQNDEKPVFDNADSKSLLKLDGSQTYNEVKDYTNAISVAALELADAEDGSFLASNYEFGTDVITNATKGTLKVVADEDIDIDFPDDDESGITVDDVTGNGTMVYNGITPKDINLTVSLNGEETPLVSGTDYTVAYATETGTVGEDDILNVGTYTITITITRDGDHKGNQAVKTLEVTARPLTITIKDQTIEADAKSITTEITDETVTVSGEVADETAVFTESSSLTCTQSSFTAGTVYECAITKGSTFELGNGEAGNNFKATNYSLPTNITAADLTVKQSIDGGDGTDPIDPTDPDDENNPIILPDGWTWDATSKGFRVTYDGNDHEVSKLKVKFTDSESGESTYKDLASEYIEDVTYSPATPHATPHDAGDYTASIEIKENDLIKAGTYKIKLQVVKREMHVNFDLPSTITSTDPLQITNERVEYEGQSGNCGLLTKEQYPTIQSGQFIFGEPNEEGKCTVKVSNFILATSTSGFKPGNYQLQIWDATKGNYVDYNNDGSDITIVDPDGPNDDQNPNNPDGGDGGITVDPDGGDQDGDGYVDYLYYYNIYEDEICEGVTLEFSRDVVREGQSVLVTVKVDEEFDVTKLALQFKRALFGYWEDLTLTPTENPNEYIIKNIYTDIYVRAEGAVPTGIESIDGAKVYAKDGSLFVQTPQLENVTIVTITGAIVKSEQQVGLKQYTGLQRGIYVVRVGEQVFKVRN